MSFDFGDAPDYGIPKIYVYRIKGRNDGWLKIGETTRDVEGRIREQVISPFDDEEILYTIDAIRNNGAVFRDKDIHAVLDKNGFEKKAGKKGQQTEWYKCELSDVENAIMSIKENREFDRKRTKNFAMRPEQQDAVNVTSAYFNEQFSDDVKNPPHFLWNAKMRFGKTFTSYQLAKKLGFKKILILTFKPAVQDSWRDDLNDHVDFDGWQFVNEFADIKNKNKPIVCFKSFQDVLGKSESGGLKVIKGKNEWIHATEWDLIILDEYHFGAWRDRAKKLVSSQEDEAEFNEEANEVKGTGQEYFEEDLMPISTRSYLYLSGTPFRALASGDFMEYQIFNWTYSDEQKAKEEWKKKDNPYEMLPRMVMMTYKVPSYISEVAEAGEFNEFDLNEFFKAEGKGADARFIHEDEVQKFLNFIRGDATAMPADMLKMSKTGVYIPFGSTEILKHLNHTVWFLNSVASCHAMQNMMAQKNNAFYHDYKVVVAAGNDAGMGDKALKPVRDAIRNNPKTITITCGKLTTGVTVKEWTGIFMLRSTSQPETYFQAAFRVQSPWVIPNPPHKDVINKQDCFVFDFAPNRTLRLLGEYGNRLRASEDNDPEKNINEFIKFLPVLSYDDGHMLQIDASGIMDIMSSGTNAKMLAKKWNSATLIDISDAVLTKVMNDPRAMAAIMSIEGFRALGKNPIEQIISKSEKIKNTKTKEKLTAKQKRELSEAEKEHNSMRKKVQEKLMKFATRIPIFMYLSSYRENTLRDVITKLEPNLFKRVTGLTVQDFELLSHLGLFNGDRMNSGVLAFRNIETPSLQYTGIDRHSKDRNVGLFDTAISKSDMAQL